MFRIESIELTPKITENPSSSWLCVGLERGSGNDLHTALLHDEGRCGAHHVSHVLRVNTTHTVDEKGTVREQEN